MATLEREIFKRSRPERSRGKIDKYLVPSAEKLKRIIKKNVDGHIYKSCQIDPQDQPRLALIIIEFAEDIHCEAGMWQTIENYNLSFFKTPLPFFVAPDSDYDLAAFDVRRIKFLLYVVIPVINHEFLAPNDKNLHSLALSVCEFLIEEFRTMPRDSGVKNFLETPNRYGWQIKKKAIWLGTRSWLFREIFENQFANSQSDPNYLAHVNLYLRTKTTVWSGLGVIDVLAETLKLKGQEYDDLKSWPDRLNGMYRITEKCGDDSNGDSMTAYNLINRQNYSVLTKDAASFEVGDLIFGVLTPWKDRWYLSDQIRQRAGNQTDDEIREEVARISPLSISHFCPEEEAQALEYSGKHRDQFIEFYGGDMATFEDSKSLIESEQTRISAFLQSLPETGRVPNLITDDLPNHILNHNGGIALFCDINEPQTYMIEFDRVASALQFDDDDSYLSIEEEEILIGIMEDETISANVIRTLCEKYGSKGFVEAFFLRRESPALAIEFLLRKYKGDDYRNYPPSFPFEEMN